MDCKSFVRLIEIQIPEKYIQEVRIGKLLEIVSDGLHVILPFDSLSIQVISGTELCKRFLIWQKVFQPGSPEEKHDSLFIWRVSYP